VIALLCKGQKESIRCNTGVRDYHGTRSRLREIVIPTAWYGVKEAMCFFFFYVPRRSAYNADLSRHSYQIWVFYYPLEFHLYVATLNQMIGEIKLKFHHTRRCEYDFCKICVHHNYSTYYDEVLCTRISRIISNLCELCNYVNVYIRKA